MGKTKLFIRKNRTNKEGETVIYLRYSHGDQSVDFTTGEMIPPQFWDIYDKLSLEKHTFGRPKMVRYLRFAQPFKFFDGEPDLQ